MNRDQKKIRSTAIGSWLQRKAPDVLDLVGDLLPDQGGLGVLKRVIDKDTRLSSEDHAEKLGRIAANVDHITEENTRLKECLGLALDLLAKHEIPHTIWHN